MPLPCAARRALACVLESRSPRSARASGAIGGAWLSGPSRAPFPRASASLLLQSRTVYLLSGPKPRQPAAEPPSDVRIWLRGVTHAAGPAARGDHQLVGGHGRSGGAGEAGRVGDARCVSAHAVRGRSDGQDGAAARQGEPDQRVRSRARPAYSRTDDRCSKHAICASSTGSTSAPLRRCSSASARSSTVRR